MAFVLGGEIVSEKEREVQYRGRVKIYTDVEEITRDNVIDVLTKAMIKHEQNSTQIRYLINFEKGDQPLIREKSVRKDIDIKSISNLAHQINILKAAGRKIMIRPLHCLMRCTMPRTWNPRTSFLHIIWKFVAYAVSLSTLRGTLVMAKRYLTS